MRHPNGALLTLWDDGGCGDEVRNNLPRSYDGDLGDYVPPFEDNDPNNPDLMRTPPGCYPVNYDRPSDGVTNFDHPFHDQTSFIPETERVTLFADGAYNLTEDLELYGEVLLNRRTTTANGYRQFWGYIYNYDFFAGNELSEHEAIRAA